MMTPIGMRGELNGSRSSRWGTGTGGSGGRVGSLTIGRGAFEGSLALALLFFVGLPVEAEEKGCGRREAVAAGSKTSEGFC